MAKWPHSHQWVRLEVTFSPGLENVPVTVVFTSEFNGRTLCNTLTLHVGFQTTKRSRIQLLQHNEFERHSLQLLCFGAWVGLGLQRARGSSDYTIWRLRRAEEVVEEDERAAQNNSSLRKGQSPLWLGREAAAKAVMMFVLKGNKKMVSICRPQRREGGGCLVGRRWEKYKETYDTTLTFYGSITFNISACYYGHFDT